MKKAVASNLRFPGKVIVIQDQPNLPIKGNLLVISDTGNNRILLISIDEKYKCLEVIGSGGLGLVDGDFTEAMFHHPQGLCHVFRENKHYIYICDTKNHAIREINLNDREVLTVTGTGEKGKDRDGNLDPEI